VAAFLVLALALSPFRSTSRGLVIQLPDPSWAGVTIWTTAPVIENGPGIERGWPDANPRPYELSSTASLTLTGAGVVWYFQDGVGSSYAAYGGLADFNGDGDEGTDADIEDFFRCLADGCPSVDFDDDGDPGTDADIRCFFTVMGGRPC
jgi:hypothetical protein